MNKISLIVAAAVAATGVNAMAKSFSIVSASSTSNQGDPGFRTFTNEDNVSFPINFELSEVGDMTMFNSLLVFTNETSANQEDDFVKFPFTLTHVFEGGESVTNTGETDGGLLKTIIFPVVGAQQVDAGRVDFDGPENVTVDGYGLSVEALDVIYPEGDGIFDFISSDNTGPAAGINIPVKVTLVSKPTPDPDPDPDPTPIPLPAAALMGVLMLGGMGAGQLLRRRRSA